MHVLRYFGRNIEGGSRLSHPGRDLAQPWCEKYVLPGSGRPKNKVFLKTPNK